jgi:hypothetical protein
VIAKKPGRFGILEWGLTAMRTTVSLLCLVLVCVATGAAGAAGIRGDYIEARTADVFTGPCFSNAEVFIYGNRAVLAWKVTEGSWNGVDLSGLCVAAAVNGTTTFSEDQPEKATAVLILDSSADSRQREALAELAKALGGERLSHIAATTTARMSFKLEQHSRAGGEVAHAAHDMPQTPHASFWAAGVAQIVTRPLDERDHACGNEVIAYPPLSKGVRAQPAFTMGHAFKGEGLDVRWDDPNCRSSFVGHFAL